MDEANQINKFNNLNQKKMKKFYAILAASLVAGTAMAASPRTIAKQTASFAPGAKEVVAKNHAEIAAGLAGEEYAVKPSKASNSGKNWTMRVNVNAQRWCDMLVFGQAPNQIRYSFEEMPQYWVTFYTYDDNKNAPTRIYFDAVWPAQAVFDHFDEEEWYLNYGDPNKEIFNWEKAAEAYGSMEAAQAPVKLEDMAKSLTEEKSALFQFPYGSLPAFYGLFNMQLMEENSCTYQGTTGYWLKEGTASADGRVNMDAAAYFAIDEFDAEVNDMSYTFHAPMGTANAQHVVTVKATVDDKVTGETAAVFGFNEINLTPSEMHIFNLGAADKEFLMGEYEGEKYTLGDMFEEFKPAQMYYVAWCTSPLTFEGKYGEAELPVTPTSTESSVTTDAFNYFTDYVTLAPNADPENTNPEGLATLIDWTVDADNFITNAIEPGLMFTGYYNRNAPDTQIVVRLLSPECTVYGWGQVPFPGEESEGQVVCKFGFGDKNDGYNSRFSTSLGAVINMKYTGKVKYHYDETDYRVSKEIDAIGNANAGTLGVKTITSVSNAETVATEYYNFQGIRLNDAPVKGMYIVREYKADGTVVAKKVAK